MVQGKVRDDEHPTFMAPHTYQQQEWVFKEGIESPRSGAISAAASLCGGSACAKDANLTLSLLSHHSCLSSPGRPQRHSMTLHLHSGLIVILHSIVAFVACHLLMWWSFINVASHPPCSRALPWRATCAPAVQ